MHGCASEFRKPAEYAYEANEGAFAEAWGKEKFPELADIFTKVAHLEAWGVSIEADS